MRDVLLPDESGHGFRDAAPLNPNDLRAEIFGELKIGGVVWLLYRLGEPC